MADPGTGSLTLTGTDAEFINSGDMRLILTGRAPAAVNLGDNPTVSPSVGSLALVGDSPSRAYGLQLTGHSVSLLANYNVSPGNGTLTFTGRLPITLQSPPDLVAPESDSLTFDSDSVAIGSGITPASASLAFASSAIVSNISHFIQMPSNQDEEGQLVDFTILVQGQQPIIALTGELAHVGTEIENDNATEYDGKYNICQRSGFRALPGQLVKDAYGHLVLPKYRDVRHPQDFVKGVAENQRGSPRPEQDDQFIDDLYPSGVTQDDL